MPKKSKRDEAVKDIETVMAEQVVVKFDNILPRLKKEKLDYKDWETIYNNILEACKVLPKNLVEQINLIEELQLWEYPEIVEGLMKSIEEAMNYERIRARGIGLPPLPQEEKPLSTLSIGGIPLFYEAPKQKGRR